MRVVVLTAVLLAAVHTTGCATRCESVCAKYNECSVDKRAFDFDCPEYCADAESVNERSVKAGNESCAPKWTAHIECWEKNSAQICNKEFTDCAETAKEWTACMTPFCEALKSESKTDPSCSNGKPTLPPL